MRSDATIGRAGRLRRPARKDATTEGAGSLRRAALASLLIHAVLLAALAWFRLPHRSDPQPAPIAVTLVFGELPGAAGASGSGGPAAGGGAGTAAFDAPPSPPMPPQAVAVTPPSAPQLPPDPHEAGADPAPVPHADAPVPQPMRKPAQRRDPPPSPRQVPTVGAPVVGSRPAKTARAPAERPAVPAPRDPVAAASPDPGRGGPVGTGQGESGAGHGAVGDGPPDGIGDDYLERVRRYVGRYKRYPDDAVRRREEGRVVLAFTIARDGSVLGAAVEHSSGHRVIDAAALNMLSAASPVPPLPRTFHGDRITVAMPFAFSLSFFDRLF
jgi:periplasmic protein TonB